jgi:hypothetical protein
VAGAGLDRPPGQLGVQVRRTRRRARAHLHQSLYGKFEDNDYVAHSCGCGNNGVPSNGIWRNIDMQGKLPADKAPTKVLMTCWCDTHGDEFCQAILDGKTKRDDVAAAGFGIGV